MNDLTPTAAPLLDAWLRTGTPWQPLGAVHDALRWFEASNAALTAAMELQQALWQPWWDAQGEWLRQCGALWGSAAPVVRGAEQLA